ncbi:MAG: ABC transporter ATP-binding protein [Lachnospiraceae bacterium]|nr:ABC transporter ATP-binding protein [Lachnospiraceae bacterium]
MELLQVQNLCKIYGQGEGQVNALQNVSFSMEKGEFAAVVGESGSGKSTLLHCIGGLDTPTQGKVLLDGEDLSALDEKKRTVFRRRNIGFVFQAFHLIGELTVEQNIAFPLLLDHQKPDKERIEELLEILGLQERRKHLPSQLSGGQQQRAAIGRALVMRPMLILADEPTGNLDSKSSRDVMDLLIRAARHFKQTVLMITHNDNLASDADRIFRVTDGHLKDMGGRFHEKLS